jgi:hypothetical protein
MDIDPIRPSTLQELAAVEQPRCVSILMPTHPTGKDTREDPIRLDNLLSTAQAQLKSRGMRRPAIEECLQPAREILTQTHFWQYQGSGLAIYLADQFSRMLRLPEPVSESVTIGPRFNIKPLLGAVASSEPFYVLAVTEMTSRLYRGSRSELVEIEQGGFPVARHDVVAERDPEEQLHHQSHGNPSQGRGQRSEGIFHGHGEGEDKLESDTIHYLKAVAERAGTYLYGEESPVILAADDSLAGAYRREHRRGRLLKEGLPGSPDAMPLHEIRQRAWELAAPVLRDDQSALLDRFGSAAAAGRAAQGVRDVVLVASHGKIDTLLFDPRTSEPGRLSEDGTAALLASSSDLPPENDGTLEDLVNRAVVDTLRASGRVVPLQTEADAAPQPPKAILRY